MASHFDRWEKDPFFSAAEEVQESADRMESTYRTWIHALKDTSGSWNCDALRRDLRTTLGTAKWQLEEFDRAVRSSYNSKSADDARDRHHEFFIAIDSQIKKVEKSLNESAVSQGKPPLPWVRLDEGEVDELAAFLSGPSNSSAGINHAKVHGVELQIPKWEEAVNQSLPECSENPLHSEDGVQGEAIDEKFLGHRRTASASADIGAWQIALGNDISIKEPAPPPRRIPSYQGLLNAVESVKELKWPKNGYRKLKFNQEADNTLPRSQPPTRNTNTCYDRNKSCLDGCDDCYDKQLYGWYGGEIGCGSGYVITSLAVMLGHEGFVPYYIATDINPHAIRVTRETMDAHGVYAELVNTDITSGLEKRLARSVDVLVVNPPYVPTPEDEVGFEGITSAWAGGENGRSVIDKILPAANNLLSDKGWLYMVTLTANKPSEICLEMRKKGYASRIILQRSTEEESLHIIKFWRDSDSHLELKNLSYWSKLIGN